jgi:hypothetical protein
LIDIRIVFEHFTVRGLDKNCNSQIGPPGLQRRIERSGKDGVSKRTQTNKQNAGTWGKAWKQVGARHARTVT